MTTNDFRVLCMAALAAVTPLWCMPRIAAGRDADEQIKVGTELFMRRFVVGREQAQGGDGLGTLFNHVSCAACHRQGAIGGGGSVEFNVNLLCAQLANPTQRTRPVEKTLLQALKALHPAFVSADDKIVPNILMHRFGPGERYFQLKAELGIPDVSLEPEA